MNKLPACVVESCMLRCFVLFVCLVNATRFLGQCASLIPNGGFDEYSSLPNDDCGWSLATGWTNAATSGECNTSNGTPDYFHLQGSGEFASLPINYFSEIFPFEGEAVMGIGGNVNIADDAREYISIGLTSPMVVGNEYTLSFSMAIGTPQVGGIYSDGWGVLLTTGPVYQPNGTNGLITAPGNQILIPEVFTSEEWQTFTFTITADQAYDQFTFGNFLTDAQQNTSLYGVQDIISLAYVFVDDFILEDNNASDVDVNLGPDLELCTANIILDATATNAISYLWNTGETSSAIAVNEEGIYFVEVTGECGIVSDTLVVTDCPPLTVNLGPDLSVCPGSPITVEAVVTGGVGPFTYMWNATNFPNMGSTINVAPQTNVTYSILVTDAAGSTASDTVQVLMIPSPYEVDLGDDLAICPGETIIIDAFVAGALSYEWNTGSTESSIEINAPGTYAVEMTGACSLVSDSIVVSSGLVEVDQYLTEYEVCDFENLFIGPVTDNAENFSWTDGAANEFPRKVKSPGTYQFVVNDVCGSRAFDIEVTQGNCDCTVYVPNRFTPDNDYLNDVFLPICDCEFIQFDFQIFNRYGEKIFETKDSSEPWIGNYKKAGNYYVQDGIYNWLLKAEAKSSDGELITHNLKGSVLILR